MAGSGWGLLAGLAAPELTFCCSTDAMLVADARPLVATRGGRLVGFFWVPMMKGWGPLELVRLVVAVMRAADGRMVSRGVRSGCGWSPTPRGGIMLRMTELEGLLAWRWAVGD